MDTVINRDSDIQAVAHTNRNKHISCNFYLDIVKNFFTYNNADMDRNTTITNKYTNNNSNANSNTHKNKYINRNIYKNSNIYLYKYCNSYMDRNFNTYIYEKINKYTNINIHKNININMDNNFDYDTNSKKTITSTWTITVSLTPTVTPIAQEITDVRSYSNPVNSAKNDLRIKIGFKIAQQEIDELVIRIYTLGYRLIKEVKYEGEKAVGVAMLGEEKIKAFKTTFKRDILFLYQGRKKRGA